MADLHTSLDQTNSTDALMLTERPDLGQIQPTFDGNCDDVVLATTVAFLDSAAGIPRSLLVRAGRPLRKWNLEGEPHEVTPAQSGIESELIDIISNVDRLDAAIKKLVFCGALVIDDEGDMLSLHADKQEAYQHSLPAPLSRIVQAILLVCHAFPRDRFLDERYDDFGRAYIPQLRHIISIYDGLEADGPIPDEVKYSLVSTFIASSSLSSTAWRIDAVKMTEKIAATLPRLDEDIHMMILARKTDLDRLSGTLSDDSLLSGFSTDDKALNALYGEVLLCVSADHLQNKEDFDMAFAVLQRIQPVDRDHISTLEELILQKKAFALGRLRRFQGRFEEARQVLETLYKARRFPVGVVTASASSYDLVCHLAATFCELGDATRAEILLSEKLDTVHDPEARKSPPVLRLKLALAEAALQQGEHWRAQDLYWDLTRHIGLSGLANGSTMDICRLNFGLARVQHVQGNWIAALKHWERALWVYENNPREKGFGLVIVYASIGFVKHQIGDVQGAALFTAKAEGLLKMTGRRHWFTGLGTKWLDQVMQRQN